MWYMLHLQNPVYEWPKLLDISSLTWGYGDCIPDLQRGLWGYVEAAQSSLEGLYAAHTSLQMSCVDYISYLCNVLCANDSNCLMNPYYSEVVGFGSGCAQNPPRGCMNVPISLSIHTYIIHVTSSKSCVYMTYKCLMHPY